MASPWAWELKHKNFGQVNLFPPTKYFNLDHKQKLIYKEIQIMIQHFRTVCNLLRPDEICKHKDFFFKAINFDVEPLTLLSFTRKMRNDSSEMKGCLSTCSRSQHNQMKGNSQAWQLGLLPPWLLPLLVLPSCCRLPQTWLSWSSLSYGHAPQRSPSFWR